MSSTELVSDAFDRVSEVVHSALKGASAEALNFRPDPQANTITWLVWHLSRVQDDHIAELMGEEQTWIAGGWADRFNLPFERNATGYGHTPKDVTAVQADEDLLVGYHDAVRARTVGYLHDLAETEFSRIVDASWDPPVTLATRLISIVSDDLQHAGQASYVRGLTKRAGL